MCVDLISALQYTRGVWAQTVLGHKINDFCVVDPIRYLSDVNILARLHMWRMGGEKFTGHPPKSRFGEASVTLKISFTDGSFGSNFIDLTQHICCILRTPIFYDWSRFRQKYDDACIHCPVWDLGVFLWILCPGAPGVRAETRSEHIYIERERENLATTVARFWRCRLSWVELYVAVFAF